MARGGYRPGAGRPKAAKNQTAKSKKSKSVEQVAASLEELKPDAESPLGYMLKVMNDDAAEAERRDRMAIAAAPFCHPRREPVGAGKKEAKDEAAKQVSSSGRFAVPSAPKLVVDNR